MKKEELFNLSLKLGFNQNAVANAYKDDKKALEAQVLMAAKFFGMSPVSNVEEEEEEWCIDDDDEEDE